MYLQLSTKKDLKDYKSNEKVNPKHGSQNVSNTQSFFIQTLQNLQTLCSLNSYK